MARHRGWLAKASDQGKVFIASSLEESCKVPFDITAPLDGLLFPMSLRDPPRPF